MPNMLLALHVHVRFEPSRFFLKGLWDLLHVGSKHKANNIYFALNALYYMYMELPVCMDSAGCAYNLCIYIYNRKFCIQ